VTPSELPFEEVWLHDFEFIAQPGEHPDVVCLVAHELRSGRTLRLWRDQLDAVPPYRTDRGALLVSFVANAECACHLALGWPLPARVLDLSPAFRNLTNGLPTPEGKGLLGALRYYGFSNIDQKHKDAMRDRIMRGWPFTIEEQQKILRYCTGDVDDLARLLPKLMADPDFDLGVALYHSEFAAVSALMEHHGVPIDMEVFARLADKTTWRDVRDAMVPAIDAKYGVHRHTAPWQTEEWREQMRDQLRPNAYLRLIENRWVSSDSTFVDMEWWDACVDPEASPVLLDHALPVWIGVDASVKRDATAIVVCGFDHAAKAVRLVWHKIFQPSASDPLDFEETVETTLQELMGRFRVREVRYDPYQMQAVAQRLTRASVPMVEFAQSVPNLTEASTNLYELIKSGNLIAYRDAGIRLAVSRAVAIESTRGWKIAKEKSGHKIDVVIALGLAALGAVQGQSKAPRWDGELLRKQLAQARSMRPHTFEDTMRAGRLREATGYLESQMGERAYGQLMRGRRWS
jgi:Phage Terminase